jgi:hypothetical protein
MSRVWGREETYRWPSDKLSLNRGLGVVGFAIRLRPFSGLPGRRRTGP